MEMTKKTLFRIGITGATALLAVLVLQSCWPENTEEVVLTSGVEYSEAEQFKIKVINSQEISQEAKNLLIKSNFDAEKLYAQAKNICIYGELGETSSEHLPSLLALVISKDTKVDLNTSYNLGKALVEVWADSDLCQAPPTMPPVPEASK